MAANSQAQLSLRYKYLSPLSFLERNEEEGKCIENETISAFDSTTNPTHQPIFKNNTDGKVGWNLMGRKLWKLGWYKRNRFLFRISISKSPVPSRDSKNCERMSQKRTYMRLKKPSELIGVNQDIRSAVHFLEKAQGLVFRVVGSYSTFVWSVKKIPHPPQWYYWTVTGKLALLLLPPTPVVLDFFGSSMSSILINPNPNPT